MFLINFYVLYKKQGSEVFLAFDAILDQCRYVVGNWKALE